jgi:phosphorylcholine metabolism protein LicD
MKVILFGASKGGENYIANHPNIDVVAFSDNDESKHGTTFLDRPVIAPADITTYSFDSIVITSQWVDQIFHQLTKQLHVPESKIDIPNKQAVKAALPFEDAATLNFAQELLCCINRFCQLRDISVCLDSGTLLGAIRNKGLIPWDDDIDLAINAEDFAKLHSALPELKAQLKQQFNVDWHIVVITVNGTDACINIEFSNSELSEFVLFDVSIQRRESINGYSELLSSGGLFFAPAEHFDSYEPIQFLGDTFFAPHNAHAFLTFMYGHWETPRKTTQITEYENRRATLKTPEGGINVRKRTLEV